MVYLIKVVVAVFYFETIGDAPHTPWCLKYGDLVAKPLQTIKPAQPLQPQHLNHNNAGTGRPIEQRRGHLSTTALVLPVLVERHT